MKCRTCGSHGTLSRSLPYCPTCIRTKFNDIASAISDIHAQTRLPYRLPESVPRDVSGTRCSLCVNHCRLKEGARGYCGVRQNIDGTIHGPDMTWAYVSWYHDPLPTNCVADWVCPGSKDYGYTNLAVFYEACTFNCLFCQNWHYRERKTRAHTDELVRAADRTTGCVCFFGGDPTPFAVHGIEVARKLLEKRTMRLCWETNGSVSTSYMKQWADYALRSNGCIKIDFKTFSDELNSALCGASNANTKKNIELLARLSEKRAKPPLLIISTLLIPGYLDAYELEHMAHFISAIDPHIPWSFLGFSPHFHFQDMPRTTRQHADMALAIAHNHGIEHTHIGNVHLLS